MIHWNPLRQIYTHSRRLKKQTDDSVKKPKILKLWLLSVLFWVVAVCFFIAFMFWYDEAWVIQNKIQLIIIIFVGLLCAMILPIFWRLFAVIDGQEKNIQSFQRTQYQRTLEAQKKLNTFYEYLHKKHKLPVFNRNFILAVHGDPHLWLDVGEQLSRFGWAKTDNAYLVLMNEIDEVEQIPLFRGKNRSPFDGVVIIRDNETNQTSSTSDEPIKWLDKFYALLNWEIPFAHIFRDQLAFNKLPLEPIFIKKNNSNELVNELKDKIYDIFSLAFLKTKDQTFLKMIEEVERSTLNTEDLYGAYDNRWLVGAGFQAKQSNWWDCWPLIASSLNSKKPRIIQKTFAINTAKIISLCSIIGLVLILTSFYINYREMNQFDAEINTVKEATNLPTALKSIVLLQNHIAEEQNIPKPFYARLGFNYQKPLLDKSLNIYDQSVKKWLLNSVDNQIALVLDSLSDIDSSQLVMNKDNTNEIILTEGFDALKSYLMLRNIDRVDDIFLGDYLTQLYRIKTENNLSEVSDIFKFFARNLKKQEKWALPEDRNLILKSRYVLNSILGQQQQDYQIYQEIIDHAKQIYKETNFNNLLIAEGLTKNEIKEFWYNDAKLSGAYTIDAWNNFIKKEIDKINPEHYKNGSWVLNETEEDSPNIDMRKQIMQLYKQDYLRAWVNFLSATHWTSTYNSINNQMERLKKYTDKNYSILIKLLNAIRKNAYIGYAEDRIDGGKGVVKEFEPIIRLITPVLDDKKQMVKELDNYQENLLFIYLEMQKVKGAVSQAAASQNVFNQVVSPNTESDLIKAGQAIDLQTARLGEDWQNVGKILLNYPFIDSQQLVLNSALGNLNTVWQNSVLQEWINRFTSRYPINPAGEHDISLKELQRFVDFDKGLITQFNHQYLNDILNQVGNQWQINPAISDLMHIDPNFVEKLNELNQIVEIINNDTDVISFEIMTTPVPEVKQITFLLGSQKIDYFNEQSFWRKVNWPINAQEEKKSSIQWIDKNGESGKLEMFGDLSLLRLFDKASITQNFDGSLSLKWHIDDKDIEINLRNIQTNDFISLLKLASFEFPQQVFEVLENGN